MSEPRDERPGTGNDGPTAGQVPVYYPEPEVRYTASPQPGQGQRLCVAAPGPYPEPQVKGRNSEYARLLLEDYAGRVSEFGAAAQYIYHHLVAPPGFEWIAGMLEDIAVVEMRHLDLLGESIRLLGGDPRFYDGEGTYWDARRVQYREGFRAQLEADIEAEREAIAQYERHYRAIEDPYVRQLLVRIIADEQLHLFLFQWALNYVR